MSRFVQDQSFYDLCDEFGIMLQQDFPAAGCGYAQLNATFGSEGALSWGWINEPATPEVPSLAEGYRIQMPLVAAQLINHPSVVRYTLGNEFYANRTWCPVQVSDVMRRHHSHSIHHSDDVTDRARCRRFSRTRCCCSTLAG
jgi:beta-galactosidase/beta-glucuronidase